MNQEKIDARLRLIGVNLDDPPKAVGNYRCVVCRENLGFVSGQFPIKDGKLIYTGRVGIKLTLEHGQKAAELAAANVLAQIRLALGGWESFGGLVRMDGYVASADAFMNQPAVLDGASDLFLQILGPELGAHTRTALHVTRLPLDAPIELAVTFMTIRNP